MRDLEPRRIDLEPSEEGHDLHLGESLSHGGRVQAVRSFDRLDQDEYARSRLAGVVRWGQARMDGFVERGEIRRGRSEPREALGRGQSRRVVYRRLPLGRSRDIVSGRPEARLERGFGHGNEERNDFRLPINGTELAHDRLPVLEMATSDEVIGPSRDRGDELAWDRRMRSYWSANGAAAPVSALLYGARRNCALSCVIILGYRFTTFVGSLASS